MMQQVTICDESSGKKNEESYLEDAKEEAPTVMI